MVFLTILIIVTISDNTSNHGRSSPWPQAASVLYHKPSTWNYLDQNQIFDLLFSIPVGLGLSTGTLKSFLNWLLLLNLCPFLKACYPRCQSLLEVLVKMCQQRTAECKQISVLPVTFTRHTQQITCFPSPAKLVKWQSMGETNRKNRCIIWLLQCYSHLSWSKCTAMASLQVKLSEISVWSTSSRRLFCFHLSHLSLLGCTKAITQSWKTLTDMSLVGRAM